MSEEARGTGVWVEASMGQYLNMPYATWVQRRRECQVAMGTVLTQLKQMAMQFSHFGA